MDLYEVKFDGNAISRPKLLVSADHGIFEARHIYQTAYSPDGESIVFVAGHDHSDIALLSAESGLFSLFDNTTKHVPGDIQWSPDGESIVFTHAFGLDEIWHPGWGQIYHLNLITGELSVLADGPGTNPIHNISIVW